MKNLFILPQAVAVCLLSNAAIAQTPSGYTSPIADYQKFVDEKVLPWKAANDKVAEIGGWRAYAKEAQAKEAQANAQPDLTASPRVTASTNIFSAEKMAKMPMPVRTAWLLAVAKQEQLLYAKQVHASTQASSELAKRMRSVGNFTRLQQAHQHAMYAEAATLLLTSTQEALDAREALIRAMGLNDGKANALLLPDKLPELPKIPISDTVLKQVVRMSDTQTFASDAPSELRSSYATYRITYDLAKLYQNEILPIRKVIAEEATLRYNGMFIGVFELLAENREQTKTVMAAISAAQAFWQADAGFQDTLQTQLNAASEHPSVE